MASTLSPRRWQLKLVTRSAQRQVVAGLLAYGLSKATIRKIVMAMPAIEVAATDAQPDRNGPSTPRERVRITITRTSGGGESVEDANRSGPGSGYSEPDEREPDCHLCDDHATAALRVLRAGVNPSVPVERLGNGIGGRAGDDGTPANESTIPNRDSTQARFRRAA